MSIMTEKELDEQIETYQQLENGLKNSFVLKKPEEINSSQYEYNENMKRYVEKLENHTKHKKENIAEKSMTVHMLIKKLEKMPQDAVIRIETGNGKHLISSDLSIEYSKILNAVII